MGQLVEVNPEYVYVTIPAEYICVYHRILVMLSDYGEDMLKDCKATCSDRNSGVIECFNMFNAAVAAKKTGKDKLASLIITYIKEKINMIYRGKDNSTEFVFPIDESGDIKAFVSCGETVKLQIDSDDMELYNHKYGDGIEQHFSLDDETTENKTIIDSSDLKVTMEPKYETYRGTIHACCDLHVTYLDNELKEGDYTFVSRYY